MTIEIHPQVQPFLTIEALTNFRKEQGRKLTQLQNLISAAEAKIAKLREVPEYKGPVTSDVKRALEEAARQAAAPSIIEARRETDAAVIPILKTMNSAAEQAKVMAERHWDRWSILRRANDGSGKDTGLQRRANLAVILAHAGAVELARWAQQAVDQADLILADAVLRANGARKLSDQPFSNPAVLELLPLAEFDQGQALLNEVILDAERAGIRWSEFERGRPESLRRIALGLAERQKAKVS